MENPFKKVHWDGRKKTDLRWDGNEEHGNPDAYHGYTSNKKSDHEKQRESEDLAKKVDNAPKRPRVEYKKNETVWDPEKEKRHENYGQGMFKNKKDAFVPKSKNPERTSKDFKGVSDKKLETVFQETRERVVTNLEKTREFTKQAFGKLSRKKREELSNARKDYENSYIKQAQELERRGVLPEHQKVNAPEQSSSDLREEDAKKFGDNIVKAIETDQEKDMHKIRESLRQTNPEGVDLEHHAREKFQEMNRVIRELKSENIDHTKNDRYFSAQTDWLNAKARVQAYGDLQKESESNTEQTPVSNPEENKNTEQ
jgi:hypothetical protein